MSKTAESHRTIDKRALRTRQLLAQALIDLGAAGDVDALDVGALAAQAGIGRSTFYAHFASKDDFLIRSFVNMLNATENAFAAKYPERADLLPSEALFRHVHEARDFALQMARAEIFPRQMAAGEAALRAIAERNLARLKNDWPAEQRRETAVYVAAGFIGLLRWWMQSGLKQTPAQMQAAFARLSESAMAT